MVTRGRLPPCPTPGQTSPLPLFDASCAFSPKFVDVIACRAMHISTSTCHSFIINNKPVPSLPIQSSNCGYFGRWQCPSSHRSLPFLLFKGGPTFTWRTLACIIPTSNTYHTSELCSYLSSLALLSPRLLSSRVFYAHSSINGAPIIPHCFPFHTSTRPNRRLVRGLGYITLKFTSYTQYSNMYLVLLPIGDARRRRLTTMKSG